MRRLWVLVLLAGCARTVPYYSGITEAQIKWSAAYHQCQGQATPECEYVRNQYALEDAYERQQRTAQAQGQENYEAAQRRRRFADAMQREQDRQAYIRAHQRPLQPMFQPARTTTTNCTSRAVGNTVQTDCN